jgi:effector-binding domain-containing protein
MTEAMAYIEEQGMQLSGNPRFCYLDGPWNTQDAADYLTEVQIPIK